MKNIKKLTIMFALLGAFAPCMGFQVARIRLALAETLTPAQGGQQLRQQITLRHMMSFAGNSSHWNRPSWNSTNRLAEFNRRFGGERSIISMPVSGRNMVHSKFQLSPLDRVYLCSNRYNQLLASAKQYCSTHDESSQFTSSPYQYSKICVV